jgi:sugar lactone lactonase YvrE
MPHSSDNADRVAAVEVVVAAGAELGEGPMWDARSGRIAWVDILDRRIHLTDPVTGATESIETPFHVGAIAPRANGGFIAALQDGFWVMGDGPARRIASVPEARPSVRFNDGKCDPVGRFWAGTMAYDQARGAGALYRLDAEGRPTLVIDGVTISNGLDWSLDGGTMYYVDSPLQRIDAFDYVPSTGEISDRRTVVKVAPEMGTPDGLTVDADGGIWVALWGGSAVHRYLDGRLERVIKLPVSQPTSCAFGGAELDELYVTSASEGLSDSDRRAQPLAGALFRIRPDIRGRPTRSYIGV